MFSLRKIVFLTILLSLLFPDKEIAENDKNTSFRKYYKNYGNFPYNIYGTISNNIALINKITTPPFDHEGLLLLQKSFVYFSFFYIVAYDAFSRGDKKKGIYFITLPLLNILSPMFPQYVWMFCYLESTKILLKLNFETGFYKLKNTKRKFIKNKCDNISSEIPKDNCSICILDFKGGQGENNNGKNNIIRLECRHYFHNDCIDKWIETQYGQGQKPTCPFCKKEIEMRAINSNCIDFGIIDNETVKDLPGSVHVFSTCIYADLILGVDNVENRISKKQSYWFLGTVLFRLGTQAVWYGDNGWELKPFIGIGGMTLSFLCINISIIPMIYLTGRVGENNPRFVVDICTEFTFYRKFFYK